MYSIQSETITQTAYITQMMRKDNVRRITGTIGEVSFTGDDISASSFELINRCAEPSDVKIGGVYIGQVNLTFTPSILEHIALSEFNGLEMRIYFGLYMQDYDEWVDVPVGVYTVESTEISMDGVAVEAYDFMHKFDKAFSDLTIGSIYTIANYVCSQCGVTFGHTEQEVQSFANGNMSLQVYPENDIETFRDVIYWLAVTTGRFATMDREGKLVFRKMGTASELTFYANVRDNDAVYSGYTTKWTSVSYVDIKKNIVRAYGLQINDGLNMSLGANPFLQFGTVAVREAMARAILNEIADIQYVPFTMNSARDPILDLGDVIRLEGGLAGGISTCIMAIDYKLDNYYFAGYGDNPALTSAKSKTDKSIAGISSRNNSSEVSNYSYVNVEEYIIGDGEKETVIDFRFATNAGTIATAFTELKLDLSEITDISTATVYYYLDEELVSYHPLQTFLEDGTYMLDLFYHITGLSTNTLHRWRVVLESSGGTITVGVGNAHELLQGQGLVSADEWRGFIEAEDTIPLYPIMAMSLYGTFSDAVEITLIDTEHVRITEDGDVRITEDGDIRTIIEEEE